MWTLLLQEAASVIYTQMLLAIVLMVVSQQIWRATFFHIGSYLECGSAWHPLNLI